MTRTTPPRPVDVAAEFPALAPLARIATRLHPRPGTPSPQDSSVGGPLLWPAAQPWPHCDGPHELDGLNPAMSPADVRLERRIRAAAAGRSLTPPEREALDRIRPKPDHPITAHPVAQPYDGSIAMLPVAQLYARDVPGLPTPAGTDLLQVLWCPFDHPPAEYMPRTALFWRAADTVTDILADPPQPAAVQFPDYVPEPCTIAPEQVTEYPAELELDDEAREQVEMWCIRQSAGIDLYFNELCTAPGWKVGGWIRWGLTDPYPQPCPACGTPTEPLLTIAGHEWQGAEDSWIPYEDRTAASSADLANPSRIQIGRGYDQIVRVCPAAPEHPHTQLMQ